MLYDLEDSQHAEKYPNQIIEKLFAATLSLVEMLLSENDKKPMKLSQTNCDKH